MPQIILPTFYYLDHFNEMLDFVERVYAGVIAAEHHSFITGFRALPRDAQSLYVRMCNRKGLIFARDTLEYAEVADSDAALALLAQHRLARAPELRDCNDMLSSLTKADLFELALAADEENARASWSKPKLMQFVCERLDHDAILQRLAGREYIVRDHKGTVDFLLFLYFGKNFENLKSFALRDLGIAGTNDRQSFTSRFSDAAEATTSFHYVQLLAELESGLPADMLDRLEHLPSPSGDYAAMVQARAIHKIGQYLEKAKDIEAAARVYALADSPECNERLVRLLHARGDADQARQMLERMLDDPGSDDEFAFAQDFYARKFGGTRLSATTALLRDATGIAIDEIHRNAPESGAAAWFARAGWTAYYAENMLWRMMFGLVFWDELFESECALHSSFDYMPQCLKDRSFARLFAPTIEAKLAQIAAGRGLNLMLKTIAARWDAPNALFAWEYVDIDALKDFLTHAPGAGLAAILGAMARDFNHCKDGFPDLLLVGPEGMKFVEIKAEGDAIRRHQLARMRQLQAAGFTVEICRVTYAYDPNQTYVVVDVETTGGRSQYERVIEIGAVKIRNGEVIEQFHSMVNPGRRVPLMITQLTGITNAMVADAPAFGEIAHAFRDFLDGAIFAAHNVNFDYGFITAEFARVEIHYRAPKFCTCANMRRYHPGRHSYSLGNLCAYYGITLENHHRALDDALAAGRLLTLINEKRARV